MTENADTTDGVGEPDGTYTDEELKDGSRTSDRAAVPREEGEYTDSQRLGMDNADATGGAVEPDGRYTDEELEDGSYTSDRVAEPREEGEYTDSERPTTDNDRTDRHE